MRARMVISEEGAMKVVMMVVELALVITSVPGAVYIYNYVIYIGQLCLV